MKKKKESVTMKNLLTAMDPMVFEGTCNADHGVKEGCGTALESGSPREDGAGQSVRHTVPVDDTVVHLCFCLFKDQLQI